MKKGTYIRFKSIARDLMKFSTKHWFRMKFNICPVTSATRYLAFTAKFNPRHG